MLEVRIHGRGGQGVVTAAELLAVAAFEQGLHAQAFPSFGSERMGAPVTAFCRMDDHAIRLREPISAPDALIVQDPTLVHQVAVFEGLKGDGWVLINSERTFEELGLGELRERLDTRRMLTVPATQIARDELGRPLPNATLLGGFAATDVLISFEAVEEAIAQRFPESAARANAAAARRGFDWVARELQGAAPC